MISEYLTSRLYASFYVYLKTDKWWWTVVSIFIFMLVMDQGLQEQSVIMEIGEESFIMKKIQWKWTQNERKLFT